MGMRGATRVPASSSVADHTGIADIMSTPSRIPMRRI
jgi:hypothetical protein